jgi:hypothetical protein
MVEKMPPVWGTVNEAAFLRLLRGGSVQPPCRLDLGALMAQHIITEGDWFGLSLLAGFMSMLVGYVMVRFA